MSPTFQQLISFNPVSAGSVEPAPLEVNPSALPLLTTAPELTDSLQQSSSLSRSSSPGNPVISNQITSDSTLSMEPGNTLSTAHNIGALSGNYIFSDFVSATDTDDYYRFSLDTASEFRLSLSGLSENVNVQVIQDININGIVDADEVIASASALKDSDLEAIGIQGLEVGSYYVRVYLDDAATTYTLNLLATPGADLSFSFMDASGDNTASSVFEGGAIRLNYGLADTISLSDVRLEALSNGSVVATLGTWSEVSISNNLVNLDSFSSLTGGDYQLRAVARTTGGQEIFSTPQALKISSWNQSNGTFAGETLYYSTTPGAGAVVLGRGGTDTLDIGFSGISHSDVISLNGLHLSSFNPLFSSTISQAIFKGTAFDYLTLADGREIYFQGIENLRFADGSTIELQIRTNDTYFSNQWNLHVSDVGSAWRFTQGASNVLLASLDSGVLIAAGESGSIVDISIERLITDPTDDDNDNTPGHGHKAISVMSSTANNASGVAGINWNSNVFVNDVYNGVDLQQAIKDTISYARASNQRVVFQVGIQGENWLNSGGIQVELERLIRDNSDIALFAVAAGNGGIDIDDTTTDPYFSSGVAKLQTTYINMIAVGALEYTGTTVNGLANATSVNKAWYSNYGSSLTLMAATDSPAMSPDGSMTIFNGTSAANPNMAAIASLVWSVNSNLTGEQLRQVLIDTAMDLGTTGQDNTFGKGLVNADAAVRRAWALNHSSDLANLYSGGSLLV